MWDGKGYEVQGGGMNCGRIDCTVDALTAKRQDSVLGHGLSTNIGGWEGEGKARGRGRGRGREREGEGYEAQGAGMICRCDDCPVEGWRTQSWPQQQLLGGWGEGKGRAMRRRVEA